MKKLLLSLLLAFCITSSYAITHYEVTKRSFKLNDSLLVGSTQWVDLKMLTGYFAGNNIFIAIQNVNSQNGTTLINTYLGEVAVLNPDGTYRVSFQMPTNYMLGQFVLTIKDCSTSYKAILTDKVTTDIDDEQLGTQATRTYYDILGNQVTPIEGLYIWRDTKGQSGKEYISKQ